MLRIRYVYPGSEFFPSLIRIFSIRDPGSTSKNLSILTPKIVSKLSEIRSGLFIPDPDPDCLVFTHPGSRGQKRHRIADSDPQHRMLLVFFSNFVFLYRVSRRLEDGPAAAPPPLSPPPSPLHGWASCLQLPLTPSTQSQSGSRRRTSLHSAHHNIFAAAQSGYRQRTPSAVLSSSFSGRCGAGDKTIVVSGTATTAARPPAQL